MTTLAASLVSLSRTGIAAASSHSGALTYDGAFLHDGSFVDGAELLTAIEVAANLSSQSSVSSSSLLTATPLDFSLSSNSSASGSLLTSLLMASDFSSESGLSCSLSTSIRLQSGHLSASSLTASLSTSIRLLANMSSGAEITAQFETPGTTWSSGEDLLSLIKGDAVSATISAQIIPVNGPRIYSVLSHNLPESVIISVTPAGVVLSGDTSLFLPPSDILYRDGLTYGQTEDPDAVPRPSSPYQWLASTATDETRSITVMVSNNSESSVQTFNIFVANNWDAHRAAILNLIAETA